MNEYPAFKVTFLYTVLGGFIGGLLIGVILSISEFNGIYRISTFFEIIVSLISLGLLAILFGGMPAGLTGYLISRFKLYKNIKKHYPIMAIIGFVLSAIYVVPLIAIIDGIKPNEWHTTVLTYMIIFGITGSISAIITGYLVLPRLDKEN